MKKVIAVILIILFIVIEFWLGEAGKGLFQIFPYLVLLIGVMAIPAIISNEKKYRALSGVICLCIFTAAFYIGNNSFYRAYNNCGKKAEEIRTALFQFKSKNGKFPDRLNQLDMTLPCSRCLRGTILEYESDGSYYQLSYRD